MTTLPSFLADLVVGTARSFGNLTMVPLLGTPAPLPILLLDTALARGLVRIGEVSEAGSVPDLRVENRAEEPVLLLDGEELVGAKQNRVLNLTILAPAKSTIVVPVSCVEAGRWHAESAAFRAADRAQYAEGRAAKLAQVSASLRDRGSRRSDQGAVWDHIAVKARSLDAESPTSAMAEMFERHAGPLDAAVAALRPDPGQTGAAFAIDGELVGIDAFDHPATFAGLADKLVRSYALDALDRPPDPAAAGLVSAGALSAALAELGAARAERFPAVGLGEDVRLSAPSWMGAALIHDGRIIHLCAFPAARRGARAEFGGMARSTRRRASILRGI
jgi:hypothetical protein